MRRHPIGFRYASALFEYGKENGVLEQTVQDLEVVAQVIQDTNLLDEVFKHPKITADEKKRIITENFSAHVSPIVLNLFKLLIDKKRENVLLPIVDNFKGLVNEDQGIAEATVYSAKALKEEEKEAVGRTFSLRAGKRKLLINNVVDKEIIGGFKIRIGDRVYDGSVANKLERLQKHMMYGNVSR